MICSISPTSYNISFTNGDDSPLLSKSFGFFLRSDSSLILPPNRGSPIAGLIKQCHKCDDKIINTEDCQNNQVRWWLELFLFLSASQRFEGKELKNGRWTELSLWWSSIHESMALPLVYTINTINLSYLISGWHKVHTHTSVNIEMATFWR